MFKCGYRRLAFRRLSEVLKGGGALLGALVGLRHSFEVCNQFCCQYAKTHGHRVNDEITEPSMTAWHEKLSDLDCGCKGDEEHRDGIRPFAITSAKCQASENKDTKVLEIV
jgi:hypothetical protein